MSGSGLGGDLLAMDGPMLIVSSWIRGEPAAPPFCDGLVPRYAGLEVRTATLDAAHAAHSERFVRGAPIARRPPAAVYINPPKELPPTQIIETDAH